MGDAMTSRSYRHDLLGPSKPRFQGIFLEHAAHSYLYLSFGMGLIALLLPIVLVAVGGYDLHWSISFFYHLPHTRDILVGALCATGAFLFLFHGLTLAENWILNIAGVAAVSIALNPMAVPQCPGNGLSIHGASAMIFFLCLALVAIIFAKGRLPFIAETTVRRRFKVAYNIVGYAMIAMPAIVFYLHEVTGKQCESHWIFWVETTGIWAFSLFWFVKTYEYRLLLDIPEAAQMVKRQLTAIADVQISEERTVAPGLNSLRS